MQGWTDVQRMLISGFASIELGFHIQMHSWIDDMCLP